MKTIRIHWKKNMFFLLLVILQVVFFVGCSSGNEQEISAESSAVAATESQVKMSAEPTPIADFNASDYMIGFLINDPFSTLYTEAASHGFLQQAAKLGYPAKLYAVNGEENASVIMQRAIDDGCVGVLVWAENEGMIQAVQQAENAGLRVVVPYYKMAENIKIDANPAIDIDDYGLETARIMCEEILLRGKKNGVIVVVGAEMEPEMVEVFDQTVRGQYSQFQVIYYEDKNTKEIEKFILEHPELVGVLALDVGSATQWRNACHTVQERLKPKPATPSATVVAGTGLPKPIPTPKPTTAPKPATASDDSYKRAAVIIALDYNKENLDLVNDGMIYALIARPYYDSTAQSVAVLDRGFRVLPMQADPVINVPIVRKNGVRKYIILRNEINKWFVGAPTSKTAESTQAPTTKPTEKPKAIEAVTASVSSASASS